MSESRSERCRRWLLSGTFGGLVLASAWRVAGAESATAEAVRVELPRCEPAPYDDAELRRTLALELRQRGLAAEPHAPPARVARLELPGCDAEHAALRLELVATNASAVSHDIDLDEVPFEARARVLALLIAESLQAPGAPPPAPSTPEPEPQPALLPLERDVAPGTLAGERARRPVHATPGLRLGLAASGRSPLSDGPFFRGAEANGSLPVWGPLRAALELSWTRAETSSPLGPFASDWWSAALGADAEYRGDMTVSAGPRLSLAHLSLHSAPRPGANGLDPSTTFVLLGVRARAGFELGGGFSLSLTLDAAHALNGVVFQAGGLPALALDGWVLSPGAGLAFELR